MSESSQTLALPIEMPSEPELTPLATLFPGADLQVFENVRTPRSFSSVPSELAALLKSAGLFDLGFRVRIQVSGEDRLRWLNGMLSNAIQALPESAGNYNFVLNAQGRIQGDLDAYRAADYLLLDTTRSQVDRLQKHLEHYIIMDDVELRRLDQSTGLGIAGPQSQSLLASIGLPAEALEPLHFIETAVDGLPVTLVRCYSVLVPLFALWCAAGPAKLLWQKLSDSGAVPVGSSAVESLRILEGLPRFGVDFTDKHLAQETSQTRALNFNKGCYLGQEIVERIRSRATVHRYLKHFELTGTCPQALADLRISEKPEPIGQLTSVAEVQVSGINRIFGIGFARAEVVDRNLPIVYDGGTALALDGSPAL